jgi:hypothetical protein
MQGNLFLGRFCFTVVGALFGFLWFNVHPAMLFMGDTGALSLGALLGVVSLMTGQWLLLQHCQRCAAGGLFQDHQRETSLQDGSPAPPL